MRPAPQQGWVVPWLASEFPGLAVSWVEVEGSHQIVQRRKAGVVETLATPLKQATQEIVHMMMAYLTCPRPS